MQIANTNKLIPNANIMRNLIIATTTTITTTL